MKVQFWMCAFLIGRVSCKNDLQGIEFLNNNEEKVNIKPDISSLYTNGFTLCMRLMFSYIRWSTIFDAPNLAAFEIDPYWLETGLIQIFDLHYHFHWPSNDILLQPYVWYSFCVLYSDQDNSVSLAVNGNIIYSEAGRSTRKILHPVFDNFYLGL